MRKPRVVFPYAEAGLGHITPMNGIADEFERLYGDKVECVRSKFFTESGDKKLAKFGEKLKSEVKHHNEHTSYGYFATLNMEFWRIRLSSWATMKFLYLGSRRRGYKHMQELDADLVVSTHWATNYYAMHLKNRPLTVMYCPDTEVNPLFAYFCDLAMVSTPTGLEKAKKKHPKRFNDDNIKQVPFLIRKEAFALEGADKREMRKKLGLDPDKFTVMLAEGGYGIGKMEQICNIIIEKDLPVNLVPVCGKNEELFQKFSAVKTKGNTVFHPLGYTENIFEVIVCADVFCGKGGSILGEATFFGVPQIITKYATLIEKAISKYYLEYVGSAIKIFEEEEVVKKLEEFMQNPEEMTPYRENALAQRSNYGAEKAARYIFGLLCTRYPELKDGTELY